VYIAKDLICPFYFPSLTLQLFGVAFLENVILTSSKMCLRLRMVVTFVLGGIVILFDSIHVPKMLLS